MEVVLSVAPQEMTCKVSEMSCKEIEILKYQDKSHAWLHIC